MASAEATTQATDGRTAILQQLRANPMLPLIVGVAVAVTLLVGLFLWAMDPSYGTLYSGLNDTDGGEIIAQLEQMQVPYRLAANGSAILVPAAQVDSTRLKLAGQGLPHGAGVGFEIMDSQPFGISQFTEHVNYIRALQGELARSIETLQAVAGARVHLAIPEPSVFVRKEAAPSAAVVLQLYRGRSLSDEQVQAIAHLVSSSVTHLTTDNITVVDARGDLLSNSGGSNDFDGNQLQYIARIEHDYQKRIEAILAPVVGRDNVRARVVADVDFSVGERTEQTYTPNQGDAAVLSKQVSSSQDSGSAAIGGVPGALSNSPIADLPSPITNPQNQRQGPGAQAPGASGRSSSGTADSAGSGSDTPAGTGGATSHNATVNYKVNQVIRHIRKATGTVAQVSAAVVVDYPMQAGQDGQMQPVPLSDERMQQIERLVKQAIGFSATRGDSVSVVNAPFQTAAAPAGVDGPPWWRTPQVIALAVNILQWLLVAIVAFLVWRKLVRPLVDKATQRIAPQPADGPDLLADDAQDEGEGGEARRLRLQRREQHTELLSTTQNRAENDPRMVAMIVKSWMSGGNE